MPFARSRAGRAGRGRRWTPRFARRAAASRRYRSTSQWTLAYEGFDVAAIALRPSSLRRGRVRRHRRRSPADSRPAAAATATSSPRSAVPTLVLAQRDVEGAHDRRGARRRRARAPGRPAGRSRTPRGGVDAMRLVWGTVQTAPPAEAGSQRLSVLLDGARWWRTGSRLPALTGAMCGTASASSATPRRSTWSSAPAASTSWSPGPGRASRFADDVAGPHHEAPVHAPPARCHVGGGARERASRRDGGCSQPSTACRWSAAGFTARSRSLRPRSRTTRPRFGWPT